MTRVLTFLWLLPRNICVLILRGYRAVIPPLYGDVCRYYPSCSAYALRAVEVHGAVKGSYLAGRRLLRCHPWTAGGYDPVPGTPEHAEEERLQAAAAMMVAVGFQTTALRTQLKLPEALFLGLAVGILAFASDLSESLLKRAAGQKDSSSLLPGHGGVLDRFDSFLLTAPLYYYYWAFLKH
jgi:putative membrane protein insertion efficiency factor